MKIKQKYYNRLDKTYVLSLILAHWLPIKTRRHPQNRKYITYFTEDRESQPYRPKTVGEIWTCGFWDMRADRQTDKQTDTVITIIRPPTGAK